MGLCASAPIASEPTSAPTDAPAPADAPASSSAAAAASSGAGGGSSAADEPVDEEADEEADDEEVVEEDEEDELDMLGGATLASAARARPLSKEEARAAVLEARAAGADRAVSADASAEDGDVRGELQVNELVMEEEDEAVPRFAFTGQFIEPTSPPDGQPAKPAFDASVEWVHGYRGWDCRGNVHHVLDGAAVAYPAAGVVVLHDGTTQRHFTEHDDDVLSLAVHPNGRILASGTVGKRATVLVWDAETLEVRMVLEGVAERAARHLAFSGDGSVLAVAGEDDTHSVVLYRWEESNRPIALAEAGRNPLNGIALNGDGTALLTVGKRAAALHSGSGGALSSSSSSSSSSRGRGGKAKRSGLAAAAASAAVMKATKVLMAGKGKLQTFWSAAFLPTGEAVIGTHSGRIYVLGGRSVRRSVAAHSGPVAAMRVQTLDDGTSRLVTGGKDGRVMVFDASNDRLGGGKPVLEVANDASEDAGKLLCVRGCSLSADGAQVAFGTRGGAVRVADSTAAAPTVTLTRSHHDDEVWGLALAPDNDTVVTTGDDHTVRLWSLRGHEMVAKADVGIMARAAAVSHDGTLLAVGCGGRVGRLRTGTQGKNDGTVVVLELPGLTEVARVRPSRMWIGDVKWSPDDATLSVASHDGKLYLLDRGDGYKVRAVGDKSPAALTRADWSASGEVCRVTSVAHELLFYSAADGSHMAGGAEACKDEVWDTVTCSLNWHTQGVWPSYADGTDINAVAVDADQAIIASADDFGRVRVFRFPCIDHDAWQSLDLLGHSSHVTNVVFSQPDADDGSMRLLSTGGNDKTLFQWRLTPTHDEMAGLTDIGNL